MIDAPKPAPPKDIDVVADAALLIKNRLDQSVHEALLKMLARSDSDDL